jgi:hypothetical protein
MPTPLLWFLYISARYRKNRVKFRLATTHEQALKQQRKSSNSDAIKTKRPGAFAPGHFKFDGEEI